MTYAQSSRLPSSAVTRSDIGHPANAITPEDCPLRWFAVFRWDDSVTLLDLGMPVAFFRYGTHAKKFAALFFPKKHHIYRSRARRKKAAP